VAVKKRKKTGGKESGKKMEKPIVFHKIDHPAHYNAGEIEAIDAIEDWNLGYALGSAVKYIARAPHKGTQLQDLKKAAWYIEREIARLEGRVERSWIRHARERAASALKAKRRVIKWKDVQRRNKFGANGKKKSRKS
jgi:hypothetical protein